MASLVLLHGPLQVVEALRLERIHLVVGEAAVELEVEGDQLDPGGLQDRLVERPHAVGGVDGDPQALGDQLCGDNSMLCFSAR